VGPVLPVPVHEGHVILTSILKEIVSQVFGVLVLISLDRYEVHNRAGSGFFHFNCFHN
jgi:hypothetical protein